MAEIIERDLERKMQTSNKIRELSQTITHFRKKIRPLSRDRGHDKRHQRNKGSNKSEERSENCNPAVHPAIEVVGQRIQNRGE